MTEQEVKLMEEGMWVSGIIAQRIKIYILIPKEEHPTKMVICQNMFGAIVSTQNVKNSDAFNDMDIVHHVGSICRVVRGLVND